VVEERHNRMMVLRVAAVVVQRRLHREQVTVSDHNQSEHQSERSTQRTAVAGVQYTPHTRRTQHKDQAPDFAGSK
jgi:hypothetical protein